VSSARRISGWWRIAIVLCVIAGGLGAVEPYSNRFHYETKTFSDRSTAERWLPTDCVSEGAYKTIDEVSSPVYENSQTQNPVQQSPSGNYSANVVCDSRFWWVDTITTALLAAGVMAALCSIIGWVAAGFRRV
jgi:hypothetical protein